VRSVLSVLQHFYHVFPFPCSNYDGGVSGMWYDKICIFLYRFTNSLLVHSVKGFYLLAYSLHLLHSVIFWLKSLSILQLLNWSFNWKYMVRGLVLDKKRGNILKVKAG
jgi:hypothetical protein